MVNNVPALFGLDGDFFLENPPACTNGNYGRISNLSEKLEEMVPEGIEPITTETATFLKACALRTKPLPPFLQFWNIFHSEESVWINWLGPQSTFGKWCSGS